jgi:hypothetical protein
VSNSFLLHAGSAYGNGQWEGLGYNKHARLHWQLLLPSMACCKDAIQVFIKQMRLHRAIYGPYMSHN